MSIQLSGTFSRSGGIVAAISKQIKLLNFKGVKKISIKFDPFHSQSVSTRDFLFHISSARVNATNPNCAIKTDVVCDRSAPLISFQLIPTVQAAVKLKTVIVASENLTLLELLQLTNKHITAIAPKEEPVSTLKTKSEKKSQAGGKRK